MMKIVNILIIALGVLLLSSCSKESISSGDGSLPSGAATIAIALPEATVSSRASLPEAGVGSENYIKELKLFIFDALTGALDKVISIDPAQSVVGNDSWDNTSRTLTMRDFSEPTRLRAVYVIANWAITDSELAAITNVTKLEASLTELTGQVVAPTEALPLLMSGKAASWDFSKAKALTVQVKRQVVKIELTIALGAKFVAAFPDHTFGPSDVELRNAPKLSYVCEQTAPALPLGNTLFRYTPQEMTANTTTKEWTTTLYAYENPTTGVDAPQATYFILHLPYTDKLGALTDKNFYKLTIENVDDALNPHRTLRNTLYRMKVRVEGFGSEFPDQNSVSITTEVLPWDAEDITSSDGEFLKLDKEYLTLKFTAPQEIKVAAHDLAKVDVVSKNKKVDFTYTAGTLTVNTKYDEANSEFITDLDQLTLTIGGQTKIVKINYEPSMAQRFARGMLVSDGAGGVTIGAPNSDPKQNLLFKFGRPMGMLSHAAEAPLTLVYNTSIWPTLSGTIFNPVAQPFYPAYSGDDKDYMEKQIDANGWGSARDAGDVCRIMGQTDGHFWRIPTKNEWKALLAEGKKAISMNGQPLQGSNVPTADFGWFCGPTAQQGTEATAGTPPKGSVFIYNLSYGRDGTPFTVLSGTLNIGTSSLYDPSATNFDETMGYVTANGLYIDPESSLNVWQHSVAIRCIRDYSKK
ncbi:MAG: hypothetical protein RR286_07525 [Mucinivorans sp.]